MSSTPQSRAATDSVPPDLSSDRSFGDSQAFATTVAKVAVGHSQTASSGRSSNSGGRRRGWRSAGVFGWRLVAWIPALIVLVPMFGIVAALGVGDADTRAVLAHMLDTVLPEYALNSLRISLAVSGGVLVMGVGTAWLVVHYAFPGRRVLEWALILPLAMPAYVTAYAYTDFLQFAGPVQSALRRALAVDRVTWFPEIRSWYGAAWVFAGAFYPYVYLLARTAFAEHSQRFFEAARTLGCTPLQAFFRVALPLARPALVAGIALVLMETLADYGAVAYFGVPTFTTGIYRAWLSMGDRIAAAQLSACLLFAVLLLLMAEARSRTRLRFYGAPGRAPTTSRRTALRGWRGVLAAAGCALPLIVGFALPAIIMLRLAVSELDQVPWPRYGEWVYNTVRLAAVAAVVACAFAVVLGYAQRLAPGRITRIAVRLVGVGYAIPGAVIALGILTPVLHLDTWMGNVFGANGLVLAGTGGVLIYAYLVRFLPAALQSVDAGFARIAPNLDASARSLGVGGWSMLRRVHLPLLRGSVLTAALLVFVDVMKELPATLALRPFNMDTLAVVTSHLAADERLAEAAVPALTLVLVGLLPVLVLARAIARRA
ncbi:iron ABC transporter permease [Pandoraea sputorum]|uniref:Spermidine/putrescine transport system permease protein PotB n=1 Tax=Pandoraea sputorum TaxID=93222 RepID=A0A239SL36_9BURK|nr:Spermidine/putrescine transport system permease protein PotB [Pandoraea sputorum]VVE03590.1 iron ABC transporter permease [Pandoraea sputorum]